MPTNADKPNGGCEKLRVLLVEDSELDAELVLRELRQGGFEPSSTIVQTPEAFTQEARTNRPDIVLADQNLPRWRGMDALDLLRLQGLDIPLILVSGSLGEEAAVECIKQGATDYILKDRLARLPGAIRRALREKQLREQQGYSDELFRRAVEASPSGILMVDESGHILLANRETERLFGYQREELLGQVVEVLVPGRLRDLHHGRRAAYHQAPVMRKMDQERNLNGLRKDGTEFPVEIGLNPVQTPSGTQILIAVVDITERRQAERAAEKFTLELQRSNAELEQFAYIASHDLQEPLRMVASYTELLGERYRGKLDDKADTYIGYAVDGARRMQCLIRDLLDYARVSSQAKPLQPTDSGAVLAGVIALMRGVIESSKTEIVCGKLPTVMADEVQLGQVFQNLINNALKFHGARLPRLEISVRTVDDHWEFSVEDNGIGIAKENAARIFQMFQRLHTREEYEGTGIGLAIAKRIVERHGGRIWFDSVPGEGTTFHFTISKGAQGGAR